MKVSTIAFVQMLSRSTQRADISVTSHLSGKRSLQTPLSQLPPHPFTGKVICSHSFSIEQHLHQHISDAFEAAHCSIKAKKNTNIIFFTLSGSICSNYGTGH
mmetsp:Transcript_9517/g.15381  ORF Transcript_9517/g.15381 Transcript_9517/m.15381 type:complete len:102 (+) Transcript_9517:291-596(+)